MSNDGLQHPSHRENKKQCERQMRVLQVPPSGAPCAPPCMGRDATWDIRVRIPGTFAHPSSRAPLCAPLMYLLCTPCVGCNVKRRSRDILGEMPQNNGFNHTVFLPKRDIKHLSTSLSLTAPLGVSLLNTTAAGGNEYRQRERVPLLTNVLFIIPPW